MTAPFGPEPICECGHVQDEHDDRGECTVEFVEDDRGDGDQRCPCFAFEAQR